MNDRPFYFRRYSHTLENALRDQTGSIGSLSTTSIQPAISSTSINQSIESIAPSPTAVTTASTTASTPTGTSTNTPATTSAPSSRPDPTSTTPTTPPVPSSSEAHSPDDHDQEHQETIEIISIPRVGSIDSLVSTSSLGYRLATDIPRTTVEDNTPSSTTSGQSTSLPTVNLANSRRSHHLTSLRIDRPSSIVECPTEPAETTTTPSVVAPTSEPSSEPAVTSSQPLPSTSGESTVSTTGQTDSGNTQEEVTDTTTMGDRVAEKLRQFRANVKSEENGDTRGSYNSAMMSELDKQRRRNLIFDEERFEETFLKCLICREVYNEVDKLPKMLHCHHTFCLDCLLQMYRVEGEFRQSLTNVFRSMPMTVKIQCPTCREGIIISEPELRRLPNDHTIMELLFFVNQTGKNEVQYCTKHQMQPLNFFCEPCIMPVCCDCTVIDHKESKGHLVVNVEEAMKKYTPIVEETMGDIRSEKSNLAEKRLALENAQDDLDQVQRDLNDQIRSVFDNIRQVLVERERELFDAAEGEIEKKRGILEGHLTVLSDRETQLNSQFNDLQKAKDEKDISQLFSGHKTAREVLSRPVFVPTNSTKGFSVTFQFSSRSDNVIKQQVAGLGDILFQS